MYNTIYYDNFLDQMYDKYDVGDDVCCKLWNKIVEQGVGKFVEDEDYIFTEREVIEIDGYVINRFNPLSLWVEWSVEEDESVKIFENWSLKYDEVMGALLDDFDTDLEGNGITYADMIFNAEEPREKVYALLRNITQIIFEQKLEEMKYAMDNFIKKLDSGEFKWN